MRLTFTFTNKPDLRLLLRHDIHTTAIDFPGAALALPDCEMRVSTIAERVSRLTQAVLHITCLELDINNHLVKSVKDAGSPALMSIGWNIIIRFDRFSEPRYLVIRLPVSPPIKYNMPAKHSPRKTLGYYLIRQPRGAWPDLTEKQQAYVDVIYDIVDNCLVLLNAGIPEPQPQHDQGGAAWRYSGFHPYWEGRETLIRSNRRKRDKQYKRHVPKATASPPPRDDAAKPARVSSAFIGGEFKAERETRFAAQLEDKKIRWIYGVEQTSAEHYLFGFYLPDFKLWVDVRDHFDPCDDDLPRSVAAHMERVQGARLFIYTQDEAFAVCAETLERLDHEAFWSKVLTPPE